MIFYEGEMSEDSYEQVKSDVLRDMSVTAGAGAGKTTSLTNRYLNIVTASMEGRGDFKPSDITAVTFTNKASLEMKEKILHEVLLRLNKHLKDNDADKVRFYKELKDELQDADISTIHSLCTNILKRHPHEAKVDPEFTLLDEKKSGILLEEVIVECIHNDLKGDSESAATLLNTYSFNGTVKLVQGLFSNRYLTDTVLGGHSSDNTHFSDEEQQTIQSLKEFYLLARDRYDEVKMTEGCLDFNDLEIITKRLLEERPHIRKKLQSGIKFLMVDEFQDTNPIQKEIIYLLAKRSGDEKESAGKRPYLFIVGDPKQSIYKFRNADVEIFNRVKKDMGDKNALYLLKNFRSHKKIVDFINVFFGTYMSEKENDFQTAYEPLEAHRVYEEEAAPKSRVKCMFFDEDDVIDGLSNRPDALKTVPEGIVKAYAREQREFEAKLIANEIEKLVGGGKKLVYEGETLREARYGDIMMLFSALTNVSVYTRELKKRGIPFSLSSGTPIFKKTSSSDMLNLLKAAENLYDDVAVCGILRSPFVLLKDSTLFLISFSEGGSFYEKLVNTVDDKEKLNKIEEPEREKLKFSVKLFKEMRLLKSRLKVREFIEHFLKMTGYLYVMSSTSDGETIMDDIKAFLDIADSSDIARDFSTKKFIEHISLLKKLDAKHNASSSERDDGRVRIMSIHAAKGLQSKIVIVPDISRNLNRGSSSQVLLSQGSPPGIKVKKEGSNKLKDSENYITLKELEKQKRDAEKKRLLYVASTRAEDYLIFSGFIKFKNGNKNNGATISSMDNWMDAFKHLFEIHDKDDMPKGDTSVGKEVKLVTESGKPGRLIKASVNFPENFDVSEKRERTEPFISEFKENFMSLSKIGVREQSDYSPDLDSIFKNHRKKMRFNYTVTMLNSFKKCKRLFYYKYVYGIPEYGFLTGDGFYNKKSPDALDPADKGNIIHKVLEVWNDYGADYDGYLKKMMGEMNIAAGEKDMTELKSLLETFKSGDVIERLKDADDIKKEATFITLLNGSKVVSKLDCLYHHDGNWHVLDYKTESTDDIESSYEKYRHQLEIYGLAAGMHLGINTIKGELYFLRPGKVKSFDIDLKTVREETVNVIKEIEAYDHGKFIDTNKDCKACDGCGYVTVCHKG
jgi:ATP-dependent helicase/nuclease subunit A